MGNFNLKYDSTKVYSNSKGSHLELEDENILPRSDTTSSIAIPNTLVPNIMIQTDNELVTSSVYTAVDQDFNSLYSPYVTSKQTRVIIQNEPRTMAKEKLDKVHIDLWEPYSPGSLVGKIYVAIFLDEKIRILTGLHAGR